MIYDRIRSFVITHKTARFFTDTKKENKIVEFLRINFSSFNSCSKHYYVGAYIFENPFKNDID